MKNWKHPDGPMADRQAICEECGTSKSKHTYRAAHGLLCPLSAYADRPDECPCWCHRPGSPHLYSTRCPHCPPEVGAVDLTNVNVVGDVALENVQGGVRGTNVNVTGGITIKDVKS
jgi:hypothetical protein